MYAPSWQELAWGKIGSGGNEDGSLINADKRIAEIKKIYCDGCDNYGGAKCRACWVDDAMCLIDDATTVDAVPVVRCEYCNKGHPELGMNGCVWCVRYSRDMNTYDFCSYGERKGGADNG